MPNVTLVDEYNNLAVGWARKRAYTCSFDLSVAATPTTIVEIIGVADKRIQIDDIRFDGVVASSLGFEFQLNKRSTAATGGSSTTPTSIAIETGLATPGLTIKAYTANPTPGTLVGRITSNRFTLLSASSTTYRQPLDHRWSFPGMEPVLLSASDILTIDMTSPATSPAPLYVTILYSEILTS